MTTLPLFHDEEPVESTGCPKLNTIYRGDALDLLKQFDANSIDLIITSPPYADQRKKTYGGITPDRYVEWFLPIASELCIKAKKSILIQSQESS